MNNFEKIKNFFTDFGKSREDEPRKMKRVFQVRRYIEWKDLSPNEKLTCKRLLLVPVFAYFLIVFINNNSLLIAFLVCGYFLYRKYEKGKITK